MTLGPDYLSFHDLLEIAVSIIPNLKIRDEGLLMSAADRPKTSIFGEDAYPTFELKAAALMHAIARNHPLVDGNKRLAWSATRTFCLLNGKDIELNVSKAEKIVVSVAEGKIDIAELANKLNIKDV